MPVGTLPINKKGRVLARRSRPAFETLCGFGSYVISARVSPARSPAKEKRYLKANGAKGGVIARFPIPFRYH
jgi:hypothetical protein